jgi:3-methyladenine DNA glycosylase/8-oxoguanine DNA glycosylase
VARPVVAQQFSTRAAAAMYAKLEARLVTAIRGLGLWSAQLFLIFYLRRPDVVASGDLGIRRAVMIEYALPAAPKPAHVEQLAQAWRPHRTLAGLLLWRSIATTPT